MTLLPKFELNIEFQNGFQDRTNQDTAMRVAPKDAREKNCIDMSKKMCSVDFTQSHWTGAICRIMSVDITSPFDRLPNLAYYKHNAELRGTAPGANITKKNVL